MKNKLEKAWKEHKRLADVADSALPSMDFVDGFLAGISSQESVERQASPIITGAEMAELERDALRYRWLRQQPDDTSAPRIDVVRWTVADESSNDGSGLRLEALDAAIDAELSLGTSIKEEKNVFGLEEAKQTICRPV